MVAPVGDGVELDAVGELHLVLLLQPPALLGPLGVVPALALPNGVAEPGFGGRVVGELDVLGGGGGVVVGRGTQRAPSPVENLTV